jgi:hypothetical protein
VLRPRLLGVDAGDRRALEGRDLKVREAFVHHGLETGLDGMSETGAQVFSGFCVLLDRGINRREGKRRMLHW